MFSMSFLLCLSKKKGITRRYIGSSGALLAQSVEHETFNLRAAGSSPAQGYRALPMYKKKCFPYHGGYTLFFSFGERK